MYVNPPNAVSRSVPLHDPILAPKYIHVTFIPNIKFLYTFIVQPYVKILTAKAHLTNYAHMELCALTPSKLLIRAYHRWGPILHQRTSTPFLTQN